MPKTKQPRRGGALEFLKRHNLIMEKHKAPAKKVAVSALRRIKRLEHNFEVKYFNSSYTTPLVAAGDVFPLTNIAQGDTALTRDGNDITLRSVRVIGSVSLSSDVPQSVAGSQTYRMIIFQDKQQVADTDPAVTDVLLTAGVYSPYNYPAVKERFKILHDKLYTLNPQGAIAQFDAGIRQHQRNHNLWVFPTVKKMMFNGASATDYQKGGLFMLLIVDNLQQTVMAGGADDVVTPNIQWQVSYNDN